MNFVEFLEELGTLKALHPDKYGDWLGFEVNDIDKDNYKTTLSLKLRDDHLSPSGAVHGGVISGFFDISCGSAVFTTLNKGELCSTVELNVKYFKPLRNGDKVHAKAEVLNRGKSLCSVLSYMYVEGKEDPVALATGTFNIYPLSKIKGN